MDYDWKYFTEDIKAGSSVMYRNRAGGLAAKSVLYRMEAEKRNHAAKLVRGMLADYRKQCGDGNMLAGELVKAHAEYCRLLPDGETAKRRHNCLVYRYMMKTALHNRAVAVKMGVSKDTVQNDIRMAVNEMLVLCFGLPAAGNSPGTYQDGVKELLLNYLLVSRAGNIRNAMPWETWQKEREKCRIVTARAVRCLENSVKLYERFIAGSTYPDMQQRPLETVKELYMKGSSIAAVAADWNVSKETVYADIKKMTGRLAELVEIMAVEGQKPGRKLKDGE